MKGSCDALATPLEASMNPFKLKFVSIAVLFFGGTQFYAHVFGETGDDSPYGVVGSYSGYITTGCGMDGYVGSSHREIDDITVPGAIGKYPLKWTRYWNSHTNYQDHAVGAKWRFSYIDYNYVSLWPVAFPDGRTVDPNNPSFGVEESFDVPQFNHPNGVLHLADGGQVIFTPVSGEVYQPSQIIDPYGQVTTIVTTGSDSAKNKKTTITEPGHRYLVVTYDYDDTQDHSQPYRNGTVLKVEAYDGVTQQPIQWVTYHWIQGSGGFIDPVIDTATYSDGTSAHYQYRSEEHTSELQSHSFIS